MTYIADLAARSYSNLPGPIRAVGWLEAGHSFDRGPVDEEFAERLMALIERPIGLLFSLGMRWCSLCAAENQPGPDCRSSQNVLLVPGSGCVYEAPIWIGHYVIRHGYRPPEEFRLAVASSPSAGSDEYRHALARLIPEAISSTAPLDFLFRDWREGAWRTLEADPEYGCLERLLEEIGKPGASSPAKPLKPTLAEFLAQHGGQATTSCAWAGCENRALADMAICHFHAGFR